MALEEVCLMVTMGFLEAKTKREIRLFHEKTWQDCVYVQQAKESQQMCFPSGASAGDKSALLLLRDV